MKKRNKMSFNHPSALPMLELFAKEPELLTMTPKQIKQWEIVQIELYCKGELAKWKETLLVNSGLDLPKIKQSRNQG